MRILVVDDAEHMRLLLARFFGALGHEVVTLARGEDVPAALATGAFDAVFSDVAMPGWNGWQVLAHVRATRPALPVVLISGWELTEPPPAGAGTPDAFVEKPFSLDRVREALARLPPAP